MRRFVLVTPWYGTNMGYIENALPRAVAKMGIEAHVVTSQLQPFHDDPRYDEYFRAWNGPATLPVGVTQIENVLLHRLPHRFGHAGQLVLRGLGRKLEELKPDVVQAMSPVSGLTLQLAGLKARHDYRLFTAAHRAEVDLPFSSGDPFVRREAKRAAFVSLRWLPGRIASVAQEVCFAATDDCARVASQYFGVPRNKVTVSPMGVDTDAFHPVSGRDGIDRRSRLRADLGFSDADVVFINSGRLVDTKGLVQMCDALSAIRQEGVDVAAVFVGSGPLADRLGEYDGVRVVPSVPWRDLADYYRAADVAIWPRRYSISQLDASACGLPLILSTDVQAPERTVGIAVVAEHATPRALASAMRALLDSAKRATLGHEGARRMERDFSWDAVLARRLPTYAEPGFSVERRT